MRPECCARPAALPKPVKDLKVAGQTVTVHGIKDENVALSSQPAVNVEKPVFSGRKERQARHYGVRVDLCNGGERFQVVRIANILEPPEVAVTVGC